MSYAMLPAEMVISAAQQYLDQRNATLKALQEKAIQRRIQESQPGALGQLLGRKPLTQAAAQNAYQRSNESLFDRAYGKRWANEAQCVLALARQAQSAKVPVCLNAELAHVFELAGAFKR